MADAGSTANDPRVDPQRAARAPVVLRVQRLSIGSGSKYLWVPVRVVAVIKNESTFKFPSQLNIAHYSWKSGLPDGECTVYLVRYNDADESLWKLLDGDGAVGVSHADHPS